ncbi:MAG: ankyrin repeat domain-containing protein [Gammaproteobacteria bacterium]|nr:ankyrin repeat domain-containing protein [Gammaproteobacteria bacterium]
MSATQDLVLAIGHFMRTFVALSETQKVQHVLQPSFRTDFNMKMAVKYSRFPVRQALWPYLDGSQKTYALICACAPRSRCPYTVVLALGDKDVRPELFDNFAFMEACATPFAPEDIEIVRMLVKHPFVNMEARGNFAFLRACDEMNLHVVSFLLQQGVDPRTYNYSILWQAVKENQPELVSLLISYAPPDRHLRYQLRKMASSTIQQLLT